MVAMHHDPVLLKEVLQIFDLQPGNIVIDATLGLAGHSLAFSERIAPGGRLIGFDYDSKMLEEARRRLEAVADIEIRLIRDNFRTMLARLSPEGVLAQAILMDLGLNSAQVDDPDRGIAFRHEGPLDMRMDVTAGEPASALLNRLSPVEIERILFEYGDERWARKIAQVIVERRRKTPIKTTTDLVDCVLEAIPVKARDKRIHPATRTFQAVRIAVNGDLEGLDDAIRDAARLLAPGGKLVVISYHSGEDRITKHVYRELASEGFVELTKRPMEASQQEVLANPRSRSAKLRALTRPFF